jgi:hypothetical protein
MTTIHDSRFVRNACTPNNLLGLSQFGADAVGRRDVGKLAHRVISSSRRDVLRA